MDMENAARKKHKRLLIGVILVILVASYISWALIAAVPSIQPTSTFKTTVGTVLSNKLDWPAYGQSAIGINNVGLVATNGSQIPAPTASVAKLITALAVLKKYPLSIGQNGPDISITAADVVRYDLYQSEGGSDMLVTSGEQLSEYQMLEAMLLPSADNIADSLAIWAFGSLPNYEIYANQLLTEQGLDNTHVGSDASGYDPNTTSTASDLVKLGELVMDNPVLAGIVAKPYVSGIPVVGTIKNVNAFLGRDNIVGIKTGNTNQAGGVYLSASVITVNSQLLTIITATMQAPNLYDAMTGSLPLIASAQANFSTPPNISNLNRGAVVGEYTVPWNKQVVYAVASQPVEIVSWGGSAVAETISLKSISYKAQPNQVIGSIVTTSKLLKTSDTTAAILSGTPTAPSKWWTLTHPQSFIHL
ncbi:MAG: D-alanyl-D-alanine carboxypeptidase family protein [Candidatus Saccharimonadales bacterium]